MELTLVSLVVPEGCNLILGQSHFIKTVEDLYEALVNSVPGIRFGVAFLRGVLGLPGPLDGNCDELKDVAVKNAQLLGAGHCFVIVLREAYPINVLPKIRDCHEVVSIFAATANPLQVIVAESEQGRGILGVIDGASPKGVEDSAGQQWRKEFLRKIGYKR